MRGERFVRKFARRRMNPMFCGSCYRRVDATRSFCPRCGSAVFIERDDRLWFTEREEWQRVVSTARQAAGGATEAAQRARMPRPRRPQSAASPAEAAAAQTIGCLGSLVRLAVVGSLVWFIGGWLWSLPEVRALVDTMQNRPASSEEVLETARAVARRILDAFGLSR